MILGDFLGVIIKYYSPFDMSHCNGGLNSEISWDWFSPRNDEGIRERFFPSHSASSSEKCDD